MAARIATPFKGDTDVAKTKVFMPHWDNLLRYLSYGESGIVLINDGLTTVDLKKAKAFVDLVGLDREPGHPNYSSKDDRYKKRKIVWELANKYLDKYKDGISDADTVVDLAKGYGFFGIWLTVFSGIEEVVE